MGYVNFTFKERVMHVCGPKTPHKVLDVKWDGEVAHQINNCEAQRLSFQVLELEL
jgi:hypothetical protein